MASGKKKGVSHVPKCYVHMIWTVVVVYSRWGYAMYSTAVAV